MPFDIHIKQITNHLLIVCIQPLRLGFEKLHALFGKRNRHLHLLIPEEQ